MASMVRQMRRLRALSRPRPADWVRRFDGYMHDPLGFVVEQVRDTPTHQQEAVIAALMEPPYRVLCSSGHDVGKTRLAAWLVVWFFCTRPRGVVLSTATTDRQVKALLWKEVRLVWSRLRHVPYCFVGPKIPQLESGAGHYAMGFTARDATSFQGHHSPGGILIVFDEAEGIDGDFFEAAKTMLGHDSYFLAIYNPTGGTATATYQEEQKADENGLYRRLHLSCLDHPNIHLGGPRVPGAIDPLQLKSMLLEDSVILSEADESRPEDVELDGVRYRPGPVATARCLGRRSILSVSSLWSDQLWLRVMATRFEVRPEWPVVIGCDVARYGDNSTVVVARKGYCLLEAQVRGKQATTETVRQLEEACYRLSDEHNPEKLIPCLIDEGGVGGGVIDQGVQDGYHFVAVNASRKPKEPDRYFNVRAELYFRARQVALEECLDVSRLPPAILGRLRQELLATQYLVIPGRDKMRVEEKDEIVARLKRSPDLADAFNLCCYYVPSLALF